MMVNLPPDSDDSRRRDRMLDFDELLAVVLAFAGIGAILWWGWSRDRNPTVNLRLDRPLVEDTRSPLEAGQRSRPEALGSTLEPHPFEAEAPSQPRGAIPQPSPLGASRSSQGAEGGVGEGGIPSTEPSAPVTSEENLGSDPQALPALDISDVPPEFWAYPFVKAMSDGGYLPALPSGQFQPNQELTRAELAALLNQAFGNQPAARQPLGFSDISPDYWAAAPIDQVVAQKFMSGYPDNSFQPDRAVPRHEVIVAVVTGLNLPASPSPDQTLQAFGDAAALPTWSRGKVAAAAENGLVVNYPALDQLQPNRVATRAEIVAILHQALVLQGKLPALPSEYVVPSL